MLAKNIVINIPSGLEARPVALLVQVASRYESAIYVETGDKKVNAKSIMGMMSMGLQSGDEVTITANGEDEEVAMENIGEVILDAIKKYYPGFCMKAVKNKEFKLATLGNDAGIYGCAKMVLGK